MNKPIDRRLHGDNGVVSAKELRSVRTEEITPDQIKALKDGDLSVFNRLFNEFQQPILRFTETMLNSHEDAAEITQDLFTDLWLNRHKLDENKKITSYLFGMARNKAITNLRQRAVHNKFVTHETALGTDTADSPEDIFQNKEMARILRDTIDRMPDQRRTAYKLSRDEGMTYEQIASKMGIAHGTVKNHILIAIREIRKALGTPPEH